MTANICVLHNRHPQGTIYVLGSGASMAGFAPSFFADKLVVAVNEVHRDWPCTYLLAHHHESCQEAIDKGLRVITSDYHCGVTAWGLHSDRLQGNYWTYHHAEQPHVSGIDLRPIEQDIDGTLVISSSTIAEAIHFAAYLGASTIILCGVDGAAIDGRWCYPGYNGGASTNPQHVRLTAPLLASVVGAIRAKGVQVHSLCPWIGHDREGRRYTPARAVSGRDLAHALNTVNNEASTRGRSVKKSTAVGGLKA